MHDYSIHQIAEIVEGTFHGESNSPIDHLMTDSRMSVISPNTLFVCIRSNRNDGHRYIVEVYQSKNIRNFLVEEIPDEAKSLQGANFIIVKNSLIALQKLASFHRAQYLETLISITGSNGKTIVKEWLFELLHFDKMVTRSPKSYNSQLGVPLSLLLINNQTELALIEAGISQPGEMEKLEAMIKPDIGIFTNIGEAHQENFKSLEEKIQEKLKLFCHIKTLILCSEHEVIYHEIKKIPTIKLFTWGKKSDNNLQITNSETIHENFTRIDAIFQGTAINISIPFTDEASKENAIHCWATLLLLGYHPLLIEQRMRHINPIAMRLELKKAINSCTLINDSYNSDIQSLLIALNLLGQQQQHPRKTLILSDMQQTGKNSESLYTEIASIVKSKNIYRFIGVGEELEKNKKHFPSNSIFFNNTNQLMKSIKELLFDNEAILLKGSRIFEFEKVAELLEYKTHNTVLEVNLNAMIHNLNYFRSKLKSNTKIVAMVKAFSYGSGTYEIANILQYHKVDYIAVAFTDEGIFLRKNGILMPIMVMNPENGSYSHIIENHFEPEIYNFSELGRLLVALKNSNTKNFPVHIKLDTGMHRLGFMEPDLPSLTELLKNNEYIHVASVFSHLSGSDEDVHDNFTQQQIELFKKMSGVIEKSLKYPFIRHILNSSGIERFPEAQFDMVRLGIGLYGIGTSHNQHELQNVSSLKTHILQIKNIPANETIGYSRKYTCHTEITIGIIPIGYADGLRRNMGNERYSVWIKGKTALIIGNICMDMCMIDITGIDANEGDEVEIFGEHLPVSEFAKKTDTIPYEVLTSISPRVKRIYYQE